VLLIALTALLLVGCEQRAAVLIDERYEAEGLERVSILVEDGGVNLREGAADEMRITGQRIDGLHEYDVQVGAGEARIELLRTARLVPGFGNDGGHLDVTVPSGVVVEIEASNGTIEVVGDFDARRLVTSNGRVVAEGVHGDLEVRTSNGEIRLTNHEGALDAHTSNGRIAIEGQSGGAIALETSNGRIEYRGTIEAGTENRAQTSNASILIELEGEPSLTLEARTSNSSIASRYALLDSDRTDTTLTGRIADGAAQLTLRTSNGTIEVR
jgi:DUF4097 and DUF4098 domain-containing protein YvlB